MRTTAFCLLLAALLLPSGPAVPQAERIVTVATYNVHGIFVPPPFRPRAKRFPEIAEALSGFDVVVLEELFTSRSGGDRFRRSLLDAATQPSRFLPEKDQGRIYSSGLAVLSHLPSWGPASGGTFIPYSRCRGKGLFFGSDCEARKGILFSAVNLDGPALHLYATHLDAGGRRGDRDVRAHQLAELQEVIESRSGGSALILAGDFNVELEGDEPDAAALRAFRDALGLQDLCAVTACDRVACPTWKLCGGGRIDYILFRSGQELHLEARAAGWDEARRKNGSGSRLSDHPLLWGEFAVRPRGVR